MAEICHIEAEDLIKAAKLYATAEKAPIIYCLGVTEHSTGTEGVMSMSNPGYVSWKNRQTWLWCQSITWPK